MVISEAFHIMTYEYNLWKGSDRHDEKKNSEIIKPKLLLSQKVKAS